MNNRTNKIEERKNKNHQLNIDWTPANNNKKKCKRNKIGTPGPNTQRKKGLPLPPSSPLDLKPISLFHPQGTTTLQEREDNRIGAPGASARETLLGKLCAELRTNHKAETQNSAGN